MNKFIDLRSDTVTNQPDFMINAMVNAEVGDDVYNDDPTVKKLEELASDILGKESALFVPSGTFGNQLCLFTHCPRGSEVILGDSCHIVAHEVGASSVIAGVQLRTIDSSTGELSPEAIEKKLRVGYDIHMPETSLICLENAHSNGNVIPVESMKKTYELAKEHNLPVHLDGARIFNAAIALNTDVKELTKYCDSVMVCLSKGLCAPFGSIIAGDKSFIDVARKKRKLMGGGLRQVGYFAAAGIVALNEMRARLIEDHDNAKLLATELSKIPQIEVDFNRLQINMVFFKFKDLSINTQDLIKYFFDSNIKINDVEGGEMRFVTHYWVTKEDILKVCSSLKEFLNSK
ncbi:L-threonine aldolase [Clostridium collagenovorans DSM 3089]|uniref:L-threonine aldolase n=1 Tax=Clostridium collagenovorans DSM 3089 TaxID=1121306 RepID=A0A1M5U1D6_9CLOT|nr:low-specificity L-threonine aldolase [Clostridium collagenovorans]SHH56857.1 L-threonine aldolase [Clostridium collagenovorans DSM 3089]